MEMMKVPKSPLVAFWLSFIPGAGHAYLGRMWRFLLYAGGFFGPIGLGFLALLVSGGDIGGDVLAFLLFVAAVFAIVNMIDMIVTIISGKVTSVEGERIVPPAPAAYAASAYGSASSGGVAYGSAQNGGTAYGASHGMPHTSHASGQAYAYEQEEKTRVIMLSIIPGVGHMSLGLMQRGITFLISFVGLLSIILFLSVVMGSGAVLIFLLALPVIWAYSIFDVISLVNAKQRGEVLEDRSLFVQVEKHMSGQKNRALAIALAVFPGAGHLYLGLQKRGLQLMGGFLLAMFMMDSLRLSLFLFLLPLFWCFAFFDAVQMTARYERQELQDEPILSQLVPYQRWFGVLLILSGVYYLFDRIAAELITQYFHQFQNEYYRFKYMLPTVITAFIIIVVGLRLAFGGKRASAQADRRKG
ncbi:hypothetical protein [Paenibacillus sp. J5C2022]|uniref:hypothetical protein n=1 Tax=Paenibacillus sp. J5C2022 TaxID=2977129 RepID=UPI0021D06FE9|nr:hypothetical protein [Paenibacillus sp. J5C2022]